MYAEIKAKLDGGRLDLKARFEGAAKGGGESGLSANVRAPAELSLRPFNFAIPAEGEIAGDAEGVLDLAAVRLFLNLEDQFVSGRAPITASLSGTVASPDVSGRMRLENARYENLKTGTVIREINGSLELENEKIRIPEIVGNDGQGGKFFARGEVLLDGEKGYPYDLTLEPRTAVVLNTDRARATAHGTFELKGDVGRGDLSGQVVIDPANIRLPDKTPPEVVNIDVVKVNAPPAEQEKEKGDGYSLGLDVDVNIPARFFVRGRGLEAEFQGDLTVNGTASNPDVRGTMSVVRGWFDFIDKRLNLERGNITFTGEGMMPILDVVAENQTGDVTARIHLTGPADDFSLRLTSNPPLPDNEIMSRLLFGRRAGDLNPVQAVQLANALRRLSGRGGGPGLVAEARRSLGLDQLNISGGEGPAPAVGVGKYLREDVYLEVQRDFSTGGEEVSVEVEITPRIGVTGSASQFAGSQVGLNYKINY